MDLTELPTMYAKVDGSCDIDHSRERWLEIKLFNVNGYFVLFFFYIYGCEYKFYMNSGR